MKILCWIGHKVGICLFIGALVIAIGVGAKCDFVQPIVEFFSAWGGALMTTAAFVIGFVMLFFCGAIIDPEEGKFH